MAAGRATSATEALAVVQAAFGELGIARVGRVTGLDRIGIPVWIAVRPNALNLSVNQGKGVDDAAGAISAAMEAAEMAMAERAHPAAVWSSRSTLADAGRRVLDARRYLRLGQSHDDRQPLRWVAGEDLLDGGPVYVPEEVVRLVDAAGLTFWQSSDGLGAGSNPVDAAVHGLCELIERDAMALWSFRSDAQIVAREADPRSLDSPVLVELMNCVAAAGLILRLFDITSDLRVPAFLAVLNPRDRAASGLHYLDLASGTGAHPLAARAAIAAVTEAAQTRLTTISGSRDDLDPSEYRRGLPGDLVAYLGEPNAAGGGRAVEWQFRGTSAAPKLLEWLLDRLRERGIRSCIRVSLQAEAFGFSVVRMIAPDLEQDPRTRNRRPGAPGTGRDAGPAMKIAFIGPSLPEAPRLFPSAGIEFRPPAGQGDVAEATIRGASVIGLVDGLFEDRAAVWHKEILFALSEGVCVFGAASMGALRAAECAGFGMVGVGEIFALYAAGTLIDDDAVAQLHAPEELGYAPLSEPLVNIEATASRLLVRRLIDEVEAAAILSVGRRLFFKDRTFEAILAAVPSFSTARRTELAALCRRHRHDVKRDDALALIACLQQADDVRMPRPADWSFAETRIWTRLLADIRRRVAATADPGPRQSP